MADDASWRSVWGQRLLLVLAEVPAPARWSEVLGRLESRFGHLVTPDQGAADASGRPRWHRRAAAARHALTRDGLVERSGQQWSLTAEGAARATEASAGSVPPEASQSSPPAPQDRLVMPGVMVKPLVSAQERSRLGFDSDEFADVPVIIELNVRYPRGLDGAYAALERLWGRLEAVASPVRRLSEVYASGELTMAAVRTLVEADEVEPDRAIYRIWPDFPVRTLIDQSVRTIKADAGRRAFACRGEGIVWAVMDSGIERSHPHFRTHATLEGAAVEDLHRDFTSAAERGSPSPLTDEKGHGSHVAGILAGGLPQDWPHDDPARLYVVREEYGPSGFGGPRHIQQPISDPTLLSGVAPAAKLVSLKVIEHAGGALTDRVSRLIAALSYVRNVNGASDRTMRIHGVNISIGHEFDPKWFACGHSPLCVEVDKLVRSGVVVVVAAGNTGYGNISAQVRSTDVGLQMTINDPGNAARAVTVGSTHRHQPHLYGVSYFSSKGPTGDGRSKPDLLAPGERILSCGAGAKVPGPMPPDCAVYVEDTGTSMAAPHVSGAIAAFLSVRSEFIGQPERLKDVFASSATSLGRERYFQGAGLVDLMRALQSV